VLLFIAVLPLRTSWLIVGILKTFVNFVIVYPKMQKARVAKRAMRALSLVRDGTTRMEDDKVVFSDPQPSHAFALLTYISISFKRKGNENIKILKKDARDIL